MEQPTFSPHTRFAIRAVAEAVELCRRLDATSRKEALSKQDRSPVTVADLAAQALVAFRLREYGADEKLVAEESTANLGSNPGAILAAASEALQPFLGQVSASVVGEWIDSGDEEPAGNFWTLDPIDGTKGFLRGGQYATALARIENGLVVNGVLGCPHLGRTEHFASQDGSVVLAAERGQGCWDVTRGREAIRLRVSERRTSSEARLLRSVEAGHTDAALFSRIAVQMGTTHPPVLMDSQAKYAVIAMGNGDVLFRLLSPKAPDYKEKIWDQAAGSIVVEEAGGRITDLSGRPLDFSQGRRLEKNSGVAASNGLLHENALHALGEAMAHEQSRTIP